VLYKSWHYTAVHSHQNFFHQTNVNLGESYQHFTSDEPLNKEPTWVNSLQSLPVIINGRSRTSDLEVTMMMDLQIIHTEPLKEYNIRLATTQTMYDEWVTVASTSTGNSEYSINRFFSTIFQTHPENFEFLLGYRNDQAVASAVIFYEGEYASIYWIGVIPSERHRGFGTAITLQALDRIRRRHIRFVVLQAQPKGMNLYERLGFMPLGYLARY
jgi:ribosomal protein S18 acetylase RimI-like enzyme